MAALIMIGSAALIVLLVKSGLLRGIEQVAGARGWSPKLRGQVIGYATSVPEFVCLVAAGLSGVWEAGLWNIASSNLINTSLMLAAVVYYRQLEDLRKPRFLDEIAFATLAVVAPIGLMAIGLDTEWVLIPGLLGFFAIYRALDQRVNVRGRTSPRAPAASGSLRRGLTLATAALAGIVIAGTLLGEATARVVEEMGVPPVLAGWLLGLVTSIPELVSFFSIYASARKRGALAALDDTQEALDNLTASNMANVGVVYPVGLLALLLATTFLRT